VPETQTRTGLFLMFGSCPLEKEQPDINATMTSVIITFNNLK
jgi:hypothetical protein